MNKNPATAKSKPRIIEKKLIVHTRLFRVEKLALQFSNGVNAVYERALGSERGGVLVVPLLDADTVLMIREYAAGVDRYELALPKGRIDGHEEILAAANREIKEEIGYGARRLQHLTSFTLAPGYFNQMVHIVLAQDLYEERLPGDEPEEMEVVRWKLSDLTNLLANQECTEARSIAALFWVRDMLQKKSLAI